VDLTKFEFGKSVEYEPEKSWLILEERFWIRIMVSTHTNTPADIGGMRFIKWCLMKS